MPPSKMFEMLTKLQSSLNCLTVRTIGVNSCVSDALSLYTNPFTTRESISNVTRNLSEAFCGMSDALEVFQRNAEEIMRYLDAK